MIKITTDEDLIEMSQYLTPDCQDEPCSNCRDVKKAVKTGDIKQFCRLTNWPENEAEGAISSCKLCLWFWVDEVEEVDRATQPNDPLTLAELRKMAGEPYWHVGLLNNSKQPHWAILPDDVAKCPQDYHYGEYCLAYRRKPEVSMT